MKRTNNFHADRQIRQISIKILTGLMLSGMVYGVMPVYDVYAKEYTNPIQGNSKDTDYNVSSDGNELKYNIDEEGSYINIGKDKVIDNHYLSGIYLDDDVTSGINTVRFYGEPLGININVDGDSNLGTIAGIYVDNKHSDINTFDKSTGGDIYIKYNAAQDTKIYGVYADTPNMSNIDLGNINIKIDVEQNGESSRIYGVRVVDGNPIITLGKGDINITSIGSNATYGIYAPSGIINKAEGDIIISNGSNGDNTRGVTTDEGTVNLTGKTTIHVKGNEKVVGLSASSGSINMDGGSITVERLDNAADDADDNLFAIYNDDGTITINEKGNNSLKINGDIATSMGDTNIQFTTADSLLNGTIFSDISDGQQPYVNLTFANGATWHNSIYKGYNNAYANKWDDEIAYVNNLTMNNGRIIQGADRELTIENYSGKGELLVQGTSADGVFTNSSAPVNITKTSGSSPTLNMGINNPDSINTLDKSKINESLNNIVNKVKFTGADGSTLSGNVTIPEGLITPGVSAKITYNDGTNDNSKVDVNSIQWLNNTNSNGGSGGGSGNVTATMAGIRDIASSQIIAWRQENNSLSKRLGEIRNSMGEQGIWTRMSRGEFEYSGEYKNQYNFFQLGYDKAVGDWRLGGAVSHGRGETSYQNGFGKNRSTSLALYGTWLGDKGHYADVILKEGRLSNEYDIFVDAGHTHGDYDTWGTSLSMEYGRKNALDKGWYITPQAEMTLMKINGADYTTDNGIFVAQDDLYSTVGRAGFELGRELGDGQNVYLKTSMLHEFAGDADTFVSLNGITNSYNQDIGNTWYEIGLGTNFKLSDNSYLYADVVKTFGDDIRTPWQWNIGARWDF